MTTLITHLNHVIICLCIQVMCLVWSWYSEGAEKTSKHMCMTIDRWWEGSVGKTRHLLHKPGGLGVTLGVPWWKNKTDANNRFFPWGHIRLYVCVIYVYFCFHSGTLIVLKHPYPRKVEEPSIYESVRVHTAMQTGRTENDLVPTAPSVSAHHVLHWMPSDVARTKVHGLIQTF